MKKNDIVLMITIVIICLAACFFLINMFFQTKPNQAEVEVVDAISSDIVEPNKTVFHKDSINPAVRIVIGSEEHDKQGGEAAK